METYAKTKTALTDARRAELVKMTRSRWKYVTGVIQPLLEHSRRAWEAYLDNEVSQEAKLDSKTAPTLLKKPKMGYVPKTMNTLLSLQHNSSFPSENTYFSATALNEMASNTKALYEKSLEQRSQQKNILQHLRMLRLCTLLDGTACLYVKHTHEVNDRVVYEPEQTEMIDEMGMPQVTETGNILETKVRETVFDGAEIEVVPFVDFRLDPFAKNLDEAYFMRRVWVDTYKAKEMFPSAPKELFVSMSERSTDSYISDNSESFTMLSSKATDIDTASQDAKEKCLLTFHYDDFYLQDKLYENYVAIIMNDAECVWFGENPYNHGRKPYLVGPYGEVPHQLYGVSAAYHILPSAELVDSSFCIYMENAKWVSTPYFTGNLRDPAISNNKEFKFEGGTIIPTLYPDSLKQIPVNLGNLSFLSDIMNIAEKNIKEVSGATDYMVGAEAEKTHISATDTMTRVDNGSSRFQTVLDTFNRNFTQPMVQMFYENDRQYKVKDEYVNGGILTTEQIKLSEFRFDIVSAKAVALKSKTARQLMELLTVVLPQLMGMGLITPKSQVNEIDIGEILTGLFYSTDLTDAEKYVQSRELTPEEQQMMQMQQMMASVVDEEGNSSE